MRKVTKRDKIIAAVIVLLVVAIGLVATFTLILPELNKREEAKKQRAAFERWRAAFADYQGCIIGAGKKMAHALAMRSNEVEYEAINAACAKKHGAKLTGTPAAVQTVLKSKLDPRNQAGCKLVRDAHEALSKLATKLGVPGPKGLPPTCLKVPEPSAQTPEHLSVWKPKRTWVRDGWLQAVVVGLRRCGGRTFVARSLDGESWQKIKLDPCYQPTRVVAWDGSRLVGVFIGRKKGDARPACCKPVIPKGLKGRKRWRWLQRWMRRKPPKVAPILVLSYKDKKWQRVARLPAGHIPQRIVLGDGGQVFVVGQRRKEGATPMPEVLRYTEGTPGGKRVRPWGAAPGLHDIAVGKDGTVVGVSAAGGSLAVSRVAAGSRRPAAVKTPAVKLGKGARLKICRGGPKLLWLLAGRTLLTSSNDGASWSALPGLDADYALGACGKSKAVLSGPKRVRVCSTSGCAAPAMLRSDAKGVHLDDATVSACAKGKIGFVVLRYSEKPKPSFRAQALVASCDRLEWAWKKGK